VSSVHAEITANVSSYNNFFAGDAKAMVIAMLRQEVPVR
jgi:hypothetical protein